MAKILVVDDRAVNRRFLMQLLGYTGHQLLEAADGAEALVLVTAEHPDLVITDVLMPTMDGYEFVRRLRATPEIGGTPVIFYTAHFREREAQDLAAKCRVAQVLTKPCDPEAVLRAVQACLDKPALLVPPPVAESFDREHLQLVADKLVDQAAELRGMNLRLQTLNEIVLQLASESSVDCLLEEFCKSTTESRII